MDRKSDMAGACLFKGQVQQRLGFPERARDQAEGVTIISNAQGGLVPVLVLVFVYILVSCRLGFDLLFPDNTSTLPG